MPSPSAVLPIDGAISETCASERSSVRVAWTEVRLRSSASRVAALAWDMASIAAQVDATICESEASCASGSRLDTNPSESCSLRVWSWI